MTWQPPSLPGSGLPGPMLKPVSSQMSAPCSSPQGLEQMSQQPNLVPILVLCPLAAVNSQNPINPTGAFTASSPLSFPPQYWGLISGHCTCQAGAAPLSYIPGPQSLPAVSLHQEQIRSMVIPEVRSFLPKGQGPSGQRALLGWYKQGLGLLMGLSENRVEVGVSTEWLRPRQPGSLTETAPSLRNEGTEMDRPATRQLQASRLG